MDKWTKKISLLHERCKKCLYYNPDKPIYCTIVDVDCVNGLDSTYRSKDGELDNDMY